MALIKAGWPLCEQREAQTCFSLLFLKTAWLCNHAHTSLACVVRGIISSLKINLNRPHLKAAFVCNLIKRVMNVSQVFKRRDSRKSTDYSHFRDFDKLMSMGQSSTNRMALNVWVLPSPARGVTGKPKSLWEGSFSEDSCSLWALASSSVKWDNTVYCRRPLSWLSRLLK